MYEGVNIDEGDLSTLGIPNYWAEGPSLQKSKKFSEPL